MRRPVRPSLSHHGRRWLVALLAVSIAALASAAATAAAAPAASHADSAAITADWEQQTLPAGFSVGVPLPGNPMAPVSCVSGTTTCVVIANDTNLATSGSYDAEADLVTNDGSSWTPYTDLPSGLQYTTISCPTASVCYAGGNPTAANTSAEVVVSDDGGQTWTLTESPSIDGQITSLDCTATYSCFLTSSGGQIFFTYDSGLEWQNLAADMTGADLQDLQSVSCLGVSENAVCVAVGGGTNGQTVEFSPLAGWHLSASPALAEISVLDGVSCAANGTDAATCYAVGWANDPANPATPGGGPVELTSADGGLTWSATEFIIDDGWLNSISCADASDCWAAGGGTALALAGTDDGGATWFPDTVTDTDELNLVSCASVDFCVATADNALWVTTDDGGITTQTPPSPPIAQPMPPVTGGSVSATAGQPLTVTGQDRQVKSGTAVAEATRLPDGHIVKTTEHTGKFFFFTWKSGSTLIGRTKITFSIDGAAVDTVTVHARETGKAVAPKITSVRRASFTVGKKGTFAVRVSGSPVPVIWETGKLPKGITFNANTGRLSGRPARGTARTYDITFTATNGAKPDAIQHFALTVRS
jgi:hypothetical protein